MNKAIENYLAGYAMLEIENILKNKLGISSDQLNLIEKDLQAVILETVNSTTALTYDFILKDHYLVKTK